MKSIKIFGPVAIIVLAIALSAFINVRLTERTAIETRGFAVVELYTSEGCSSCPPADALVAKIERESAGKPVYILAYHVDYWNHLGWKDQFSSADYSKRQRDYAHYLKTDGIYTPQIVVNGKTEFVGSEEATLRKAISVGLQNGAATKINLYAADINAKQATLKYSISNTDKNDVLQVAVIEKSANSKVAAGENSGRTLAHVQIVRKLQAVMSPATEGAVNIALPDGFNSRTWEVIAFLQNKSTGLVTGAARASFLNDGNSSAALSGK
ncbi:MAG: DUF1223 domain-containing protein [Mucilaginibacter sp.]